MGKLTHWAATFVVIALLAALLGFGGVAGEAAPIAEVLFWLSLGVIGIWLTCQVLRRT